MAEMTMMLLLFIQANNDKRYDIYHQTEMIKSVTMLLIEIKCKTQTLNAVMDQRQKSRMTTLLDNE